MAKNRFGLSRDIPAEIARAVRQRDGFGCVVCGSAIFEYDHLEPDFANAPAHTVEGIVSLCSEHHRLKTNRLLSVDTIKEHAKNPKAKEQGFSFGPFDIGTEPPEVVLGTCRTRNVKSLIHIFGDDLLSIAAPSAPGLPFLLSACIFGIRGYPIFQIVENQWITNSHNWDVQISGPTITIRKSKRNILLKIRSEPPHQLIFERIDMTHKGTKVYCEEGKKLTFQLPDGQKLAFSDASIQDADWALFATSRGWGFGYSAAATLSLRITGAINPSHNHSK